jgi:hypothetical protein
MTYRRAVMQTAGGFRRLPGLLFLAIVILAIAALLAGYGIPVGVGALAGLVLGAIAGMLGSLWLARGAGRSIGLAGVEWSSDLHSGAMSAELLADMREMSEVYTIDLGPIRSILPVLATVEASGLRVELVAIEVHEAGARITLDVRALPGALPPPSSPQVSVTDTVGTQYRASGQGQGGSLGEARYEIVVVPALVLTSGALMVRVDRFVDLFPDARRAAVGPWLFTVGPQPNAG